MAVLFRRSCNRGTARVWLWPQTQVSRGLAPGADNPFVASAESTRALSAAAVAPAQSNLRAAERTRTTSMTPVFNSSTLLDSCLKACESQDFARVSALLQGCAASGTRLSHALQGQLLITLARQHPTQHQAEWARAVIAVLHGSIQPLSPKGAWRCLHTPKQGSLPAAAARDIVSLAAQHADVSTLSNSARQFWCDASAAACVEAVLSALPPDSEASAGPLMAWARSLHFDRLATLRVAANGTVVCEYTPGDTEHGVPSAVVSLDLALAAGAEEGGLQEGPARGSPAAAGGALPVVQLRTVLLESDALARAVPFPGTTAAVAARLLAAGHLKFARQLFHATAPRLVAAAWGNRPRVHPWGKGGLRAVQDLGQALQQEGRLRRHLAHAPPVAAAYVRGLVLQGRLAEAEQVHFAQRGQAANATLAALLPAVASSGQVQHMAYLLGDGARVGTSAPATAAEWLLDATCAQAHDAACSTDGSDQAAGPPGGAESATAASLQPLACVEQQLLQRQMQAEHDALAQGQGILRALGSTAVRAGSGIVSAAAHSSHGRRGVAWRESMAEESLPMQRLLQLRAAYSRLLAAGCSPSLRLEQHLAGLAVELGTAASSCAQAGAPTSVQPEAAWRLVQESLRSLQDTFPREDRSTVQQYQAALQAVRSPWWFAGDQSLQHAHGRVLGDALCAAPEQLHLVAHSCGLSQRMASSRSEDAPRQARRVAAGLRQLQVPVMAIEERLKVAHARAGEAGSPLLLQAAAPWRRVQEAALAARRAVADLRAAAAHEHTVRQAARPLRGSLSHIEQLLSKVLG